MWNDLEPKKKQPRILTEEQRQIQNEQAKLLGYG